MKDPVKKIRTAVVGLGYVATCRHIPTMEESGLYEIAGVIDRHPGRAKELAAKKGYANYAETDDLEKVEWLEDVEAVTVSVDPQCHYKIIKSALSLGKHVLTEKPFAMKIEEGEELVKLARSKGLKLGIVHNFQFSNSASSLVRDIGSGKIGKIRSITAVQFCNPERRAPDWCNTLPLGLFYDESPHFFYLISRLAPGELTFVGADVYPSTMGRPTPALINVRFKCSRGGENIPVTMNMNFESPISEWHVMVAGENYLGDIDVFRDIYVRLPNDGEHLTHKVFRTTLLATWQHLSQHLTMGIGHLAGKLRYGNEKIFGYFARAILDNTEVQYIGPEEALKVLRLMHEVLGKSKLIT
ncbi:MAG: Gfo/Idh/MocA family oxidoreductase [Candidatus Omnitrophica bacterium]|nr:Gfo/Idh/MocA family oxidoreductase [Candidatus Omnitrophota bacterium]